MYSMYQPLEVGDGPLSTGWLPPMPSFKDYTAETKEVSAFSTKIGLDKKRSFKLNPKVDLRKWCSPIENQLNLGSCTAHAGVGIIEYYERRAFGQHINGSRLFTYKTTRNLMGVTGDTGAWLRNTMGALAIFGVAPEKFYPYVVSDFDEEPSAFLYQLADKYEAASYFSHDPIGSDKPRDKVLLSVKTYLACGIPSMFGFFGFPSFDQSNQDGKVPFPCPGERARWGHAIVAVGYDDNCVIQNTACNMKTKGALLFRNSWGTGWGEDGYGWMPYEYVLNNLALDFWSLLSMRWINSKQFGFDL